MVELETAVHVVARRYPAASHRKVNSRLRLQGYVVNKKELARLRRV